MSQAPSSGSGVLAYVDHEVAETLANFQDPSQEWRRLFSELLGTFFLVLVAAGGGMMGQAFPDTISRTAAVVAPGLMVMAIILFMGKVSGAHLNPAVSIAFSLRGDFPWRRVPGYIVVQLIGATLAALFLHAVVNVSATYGSNYPASGYSGGSAFLMEAVLTLGLVSVILGTASGAQNVGLFGAIGVGGYIALAGLWGSPISGASMNPARTFGPDLVGTTFTSYWVYVAGPLVGAALAVGAAWVLRGAGGGKSRVVVRRRASSAPRSLSPTRPDGRRAQERRGGGRLDRLRALAVPWHRVACGDHRRREVVRVGEVVLDRRVDPAAELVPAVADDADRHPRAEQRLREVAGRLPRRGGELGRVDPHHPDPRVDREVEARVELDVDSVAVVDGVDHACVRAERFAHDGMVTPKQADGQARRV